MSVPGFPDRTSPRRVAVVDGARIPFARAWTAYKQLGAADLGAAAIDGLLNAADLDPSEVDQLFFGCVAATPNGPHIGREAIFRSALPPTIPAVGVQMYCASGAQAVVDGAHQIALGHADVVVAGGAESMSENQVLFTKKFTHALQAASRAKTLGQRLGAFKGIGLGDLKPQAPGIDEPTIGKSMGQTAEIMAKAMGISREEQDEWALTSHHRAAKAYEDGILEGEVVAMPIPPKYGDTLTRDTDIRADTTLEKMAKLRPVFDRKYGTVTAGNSSPLTDGAAVVLLMSEEKARALGYEPLAYIHAYATAGIDIQKEHLLMGPTYSAPIALKRAGMELKDIDLIEMHEAFASQVIATLRRFESADFAKEIGLAGPLIKEVDRDRLNPHGSSIPVGHPFGATGARIISRAAHGLAQTGKASAFISICAAGGLGFSMVLVRE
jgi:acetyl-CoA acyltransferase